MYSPDFSVSACVMLRRLAWAFDMPMTKTLDQIFQLLPSQVDGATVCLSCKDKSKCSVCGFSKHSADPETLALFAAH